MMMMMTATGSKDVGALSLLTLLLSFYALVTEAFVGVKTIGLKTTVPSLTKRCTTSTGSSLSMSAALIVQNKGGGHGELGYQLAKTLQGNDKISSITILQDDACKDTEEPFRSYGYDLPDVTVIKAKLGGDGMDTNRLKQALGGATFEYVWDNASKNAKEGELGKAVVDCAREWNVNLLTYVSSAGAYKPTKETVFPMDEAMTPVKESAGQVEYENYATAQGVRFCAFRPQYIYGRKANKWDYLDWYFDRLYRKLPLPIPEDGTQKVSLTNSEDVASLLASVLNDEAAAIAGRIFNCGTDKLYTYDEVANMCAAAAGIGFVGVEHYDGELYGKAKFPFRLTDFYVAPDKAKAQLGWGGPKHDLKDDLAWYWESYQFRGGLTKSMKGKLIKDWEIMVGSKTSLQPGSVYDEYDPLDINMDNVQELGFEV